MITYPRSLWFQPWLRLLACRMVNHLHNLIRGSDPGHAGKNPVH
jgi:hypothetical protein